MNGLLSLLAIDSADRLSALDDLDPQGEQAMFAVRDVALGDEDATVRAHAVTFLGGRCKSAHPALATALGDALYDTHPSVRMAAVLAMAKQKTRHPLIARLVLEEPIWWVRRAAVLSLARLERMDAVPTLKAALDDPFWRVRHAAVRALLGLEVDIHDLSATDLDASERAAAALKYLERRLRGGEAAPITAPTTTTGSGKIFDPDPAVIAAHLENGREATAAELALYLGDAHEALRNAAGERLMSLGDLRALETAALWLEEPRIPHATRAVVELLDRLGPEAGELLTFAFENIEARPGLAVWAISYVANGDHWEYAQDVVEAMSSANVSVRRAAIAAAGKLLPETRALIEAAVKDTDEDVRRLAIHALVTADALDDRVLTLVDDIEAQPALVRRLLVSVMRDEDALALRTRDSDPIVRASAVSRLHRFTGFSSLQLQSDDDPWIRGALLDGDNALSVLANDSNPRLKRAAFEVASRNGQAIEAARAAWNDEDAWLRARAAERLVRSPEEADLCLVLRLSRDADVAVRSAAANATTLPNLRDRLLALPADSLEPIEREAADTWLGIRATQVIAQHLYAPPGGVTTTTAAPLRTRSMAPPKNARLLARGIEISPLVLSGANEPTVGSFFRATNEGGCNAVFWEPRYRNLSAFLKTSSRGQGPVVIAGTYHATARAIRKDVEQTLRRLGRDAIDVFLIYWVRSAARLRDEVPEVMQRLRAEGKVRAIGFSTHDRELACDHARDPWDVMMIRHSAAHPGAETKLFPLAKRSGIGVLAFSATSYGRLVTPTIPAADCYRYCLAQPGVTACVSAPRGGRELIDNLAVIAEPMLTEESQLEAIRAHGRDVRKESLDFGAHIRRFPALPPALPYDDADADADAEARHHLPFDA